jgi:hypothetical protein
MHCHPPEALCPIPDLPVDVSGPASTTLAGAFGVRHDLQDEEMNGIKRDPATGHRRLLGLGARFAPHARCPSLHFPYAKIL